MCPPDTRVAAVGLDLGSTNIKAGTIDARGRLSGLATTPAPALRGTGAIREGDAADYERTARELLERIAGELPRGTPLGIAAQRSTFTLWNRESGRAAIPLISWQDRRAADWCDARREIEPEIVRRTGLLLSAHYAGPKLAAMQEIDPAFAERLRDPDFAFGTLETFVLWHWSAGAVHATDPTIAARTLMFDLERRDWSPELLAHYAVPRAALPRIERSAGRDVPLESGLRLRAALADQASGALAALDAGRDALLINLGTGAFVLRPTATSRRREPGYLTAPILGVDTAERYVLEGTVNGSGPALDRFGRGAFELPETDPSPAAFAIPDRSGLGSPHWLPDVGLTFSAAADALDDDARRRVVLEGLLFRIRSIVDDLCGAGAVEQVRVGGGLARDPAIAPGLATLLGRPVELLLEPETTLLGAARLAAGLAPWSGLATRRVEPRGRSYLVAKYPRWREWLAGTLVARRGPDRSIYC